MEYRTLGRTGLRVSAISLGTEYLINLLQEQVNAVIHAALDQGINYLDVFWSQPRFRDQMGVALQGRREQVLLAAHLGSVERDGQYEKSRDVPLSERFFWDFLTRYRTDYVDILFLHNCDPQEDYDELMRPGGLMDVALRLKQEGRARFLGFSGHTVSTALQAVEHGAIDVLMFPINLASHAVPGKRELFSACAAHGVGLVAMKPFAGGKLLQQERTIAMEHWQTGGEAKTLAKPAAITPVQCLAYVLAQAGVSTIVPGCKTVEQLEAALAYWQASPEEKDFSAVVAEFQQYVSGECVYCNHCLPCPSFIDIGGTIRLLETAQRQMTDDLRAAYAALPSHAEDCIQCGACMERCPFGVNVISKMEQAAALFV